MEKKHRRAVWIGCKLVKVREERIFLDDLKPTDRGGKISNYECGIFCEMY